MQHNKMEIMEKCQAEGCPITAVFTIGEAAEHPHFAARGFFVDIEHPELGKVRDIGAPFKLPACPGGPVTPAPLLGQHNREVYSTILGLPDSDLATLKANGTI